MTRFNISLQEGVEMVLWALQNSLALRCLYRKFLAIAFLMLRRLLDQIVNPLRELAWGKDP